MNLETWQCAGKTVFVRADLNVPLKDGEIYNDFRLIKTIPTLEYLLKKQAKIILATHLGRPDSHQKELSTKIIATYLSEHGIPTRFCPTLDEAYEQSKKNENPEILLLENLRFHSEEQSQDPELRKKFAQQLAKLGQYYANDAWGTEHRNDTSITTLAELYLPEKKSYGFLVQQEIDALKKLKNNVQEPFLVMIGGGKVADKLPYIEHLINNTSANPILIGPALAFTFLKAQNKNVGKSLVDPTALEDVKNVMQMAQRQGKRILLPTDVLVACQTLDGPLAYTSTDAMPDNAIGVTVGPQTTATWSQEIRKARTILYNGSMGFFDRPATMYPLGALLQSISHSDAYTVVAGGDAVAAVYDFEKENDISFCSTGGGATLAYVSGALTPGLDIK